VRHATRAVSEDWTRFNDAALRRAGQRPPGGGAGVKALVAAAALGAAGGVARGLGRLAPAGRWRTQGRPAKRPRPPAHCGWTAATSTGW
jgi:hypothetical protein